MPASDGGAEGLNGLRFATAARPRTSWTRLCAPCPRFGGLILVTFAPLGGETSKTDLDTGPKEMSVARSSSTGELEPLA